MSESMNGVVVVDKPSGWTSHDVVNKLRRLSGIRKIGHLGTLDPQATGVLPLLIGRATRLAQFFTRNDKLYEGVIRFGWSTDTYDADGEPTSPRTDPVLTRQQAESLFARFRGPFLQTPPPVSAKKIEGKPAYELARRNIAVELKPVEVTVFSLEVLDVCGAEVKIRAHTSGGTYIRSIAHEAGLALGCGAFLKSLRRLASGPFDISRAKTLDELAELAAQDRLKEALIPAAELLPEFPLEVVDPVTEGQIRQGRDFRVSPFRSRGGARYVKVVTRDGELVAIGEAKMPNVYHPLLVL